MPAITPPKTIPVSYTHLDVYKRQDGKYILQRKIEGMGAAYTPGNIDEVAMFYKLSSHLDLLYKIAVKNIDLKELKDFQVIGNRLEQPKHCLLYTSRCV